MKSELQIQRQLQSEQQQLESWIESWTKIFKTLCNCTDHDKWNPTNGKSTVDNACAFIYQMNQDAKLTTDLFFKWQAAEEENRILRAEIELLTEKNNKLKIEAQLFPSVKSQASSWEAVCEVLELVSPEWWNHSGSGRDLAVKTIHNLATYADAAVTRGNHYESKVADLMKQIRSLNDNIDEKAKMIAKLSEDNTRLEKNQMSKSKQKQQAAAWEKVANTLTEVSPGWIDTKHTSIECAVNAIRKLAQSDRISRKIKDDAADFVDLCRAIDELLPGWNQEDVNPALNARIAIERLLKNQITESQRQQASSWEVVFKTVKDVAPELLDKPGSGETCVVNAIKTLAKDCAGWRGAYATCDRRLANACHEIKRVITKFESGYST